MPLCVCVWEVGRLPWWLRGSSQGGGKPFDEESHLEYSLGGRFTCESALVQPWGPGCPLLALSPPEPWPPGPHAPRPRWAQSPLGLGLLFFQNCGCISLVGSGPGHTWATRNQKASRPASGLHPRVGLRPTDRQVPGHSSLRARLSLDWDQRKGRCLLFVWAHRLVEIRDRKSVV